MQVIFEKNADDFMKACGTFLRQNEIEHNVILTLCARAEAVVKAGQKIDTLFAHVDDEDGCALACIKVGARELVLSLGTQAHVEFLAEVLAEKKTALVGVVGPADVAATFSDKWTALTAEKPVSYMDQIIYSLTRTQSIAPVQGSLRPAATAEVALLASWMEAFAAEALPDQVQAPKEQLTARTAERIAEGSLFVWDVNGTPVAQAAFSGKEDIARISMVYTPLDNRGKGYATAAVEALSAKLLAEGRRACCLYADAKNTVSNSMYRKIGYAFAGRSSMYLFGDGA